METIQARAQTPSQHFNFGQPTTPRKPRLDSPFIFTIFFGILWPASSLLVELVTGMTSQIWIDPIPTPWHIALIAWVPIANALLLYFIKTGRAVLKSIFLLHGLAAGISIFYWIELFPFTIFGVLLCWTGIGLLPLGPVASCIATFRLRNYCRKNEIISVPRLHGVIATFAAIGILLALELFGTGSALGLTLAANGSPAQRVAGEKILRAAGPNSEIVRFAAGESANRFYTQLDIINSITGIARPTREDAAREVYRATGENVAHLNKTRYSWDAGRAGTRVGSLLHNVALAESQTDTIANANDGFSYTEWTMNFKNTDPVQHEARCEVLLPPGGVVSRLTLWVNGEEREAAFAANQIVRQAYTQVVARSQDPVLVTYSGPGRVLVQWFPVPPGGFMKIRFGITAPLLPETDGRARYTFPMLTDQNFIFLNPTLARIRGELLSKLPDSRLNNDPKDQYIESTFTLHHLAAAPSIELAAPTVETKRWRRDTRDPNNQFIVQTIHKVQPPASKPVFVIDGSVTLQKYSDEIRRQLARFPNAPIILATGRNPQPIKQQYIDESNFSGGADNVLALDEALAFAAREKLDTIVWIHGPQSVLLTPITKLNDAWRKQLALPLVAIPLVQGENALLRELEHSVQVENDPRLEFSLRKLTGAESIWKSDFESVSTLPEGLPPEESSSHLARLWAAREIPKLLATGRYNSALELGPRYQLVTPISGAVVLETKKQYDDAGLTPIDSKTAPAVPEPTTWVLLLTGLTIVVTRFRPNKRHRPSK